MKAIGSYGCKGRFVGKRVWLVFAVVAVISMIGCSHTEKVKVPPRVDLNEYQTIGIINFSGNSEENIEPLVTQKFMQSVQSAQPNVRFLELGSERDLLREINRNRLDARSVKTIGKRYEIDALFTGNLQFSEVKPTFNVSSSLTSVKAKAYIEGSLNTRLWEARNGATRWTQVTSGKKSVANMNLSDKGPISFGVTDPNEKYEELIQGLVRTNTKDFYPYYVTRKVSK